MPYAFIDERKHPYWERYFNCVEAWHEEKPSVLLKRLDRLIELDPDYLHPYNLKANILEEKDRMEDAEECRNEAYRRALKMIVTPAGKWPDKMEWAWTENRHIMQALEEYGMMHWERGNIEQALHVFRQLFRMNPNDNQGIRFFILTIRMGISFHDYRTKILPNEQDLMLWNSDFTKYAKEYPDDFDVWLTMFGEFK